MSCGIRTAQTEMLDSSVGKLRHIKGARLQALARMGIFTVRDLLENFPRRYLDMSQVSSVRDAEIGSRVTVIGNVGEVNVKQPRPKMNIVEISVIDETGCLFATWFGQPWMAKQVAPGDTVSLSGKIEFSYGFKKINAPFIEILKQASDVETSGQNLGHIIPLHPLTADISSAWMRRFIATALAETDSIFDPLPAALRIRRGLMNKATAYRMIHFPQTMEEQRESRRRLAYEELLALQLHLALRRKFESQGSSPFVHVVTGATQKRLTDALSFKLTDEQSDAIHIILGDMARPHVMNRMLLGDVGTGKTVVAAYALAAVKDTGSQAAMMAPTSVLAAQYGNKLGPIFDKIGITWALLTGATPSGERTEILTRLAEGEIDVVFGTHALIQDDVVFSKLSLTIIDEQHRFGVNQRAALRAKGPGCDFLVMTATPIPRTLALTLYGDLDCTYLKKRPFDLAPVKTTVIKPLQRPRAYDAIREEVKRGRQAYIICPLVGVKKSSPQEPQDSFLERIEDGCDLADVKAATAQADFLAKKVFPEMRVGLLTGKMSSVDKTSTMDRFCKGDIDILVSTTVVEVGVDVPNATVMLIEDADCFGLSQLHQLRGRVGRGEFPGSVFLLANPKTDEARARLKALEETSDGFELAECDLRLRHEGDVLGSRQSGISNLKLVNIIRDADLITSAYEDARVLLDKEPGVENLELEILMCEVERIFDDKDR